MSGVVVAVGGGVVLGWRGLLGGDRVGFFAEETHDCGWVGECFEIEVVCMLIGVVWKRLCLDVSNSQVHMFERYFCYSVTVKKC